MDEKIEDWRQFYRKPGEPPIEVGDILSGIQKEKDGQWVRILARAEVVELLNTESDGGRIYGVKLSEDVQDESRQN